MDTSPSLPGPRWKMKRGKAGCEKGRKMERMKIKGREEEGSEEAVGARGASKTGNKQLSDNAAGSLNLYF